MANTSHYPLQLYKALSEAHSHKEASVINLLFAMRSFYDSKFYYDFLLNSLKEIPSEDAPMPSYPPSFAINNPSEFKSSFITFGIPREAIVDVSYAASNETSRLAFQTIGDLLTSLAYKLFSSMFFHRSGFGKEPILNAVDPDDRQKQIKDILESNYEQYKNLALSVTFLIKDEIEKVFIIWYIALIDSWIYSKCFYLFHEPDPKLAIEKTSQVFVMPMFSLNPREWWYNLEYVLWQRSEDPVWKALQFKLLFQFDQILLYLEKIDQNRGKKINYYRINIEYRDNK